MRTTVAATLLALAGMPGFALPIHAGTISGTISGDSTLTSTGTTGVYAQSLTGDGTDTTYGMFTIMSQSTIDFHSPPAITVSSGMFTETFAGGTLFGTSSGDGTASGMSTATVSIDLVFT